MEEVEFFFDNQLIAELEKLIRASKNRLLLISPFIDFDARIKEALNEKINEKNFRLEVLFGKNDGNYLKSIKKESLKFLMRFPNIEIKYDARLHAKFYLNDFDYLMTSLNLYNYSLANNIEVGIKGFYASKGVLLRAVDASYDLIGQGVEKVKQDVLGMNKNVGPVQKFEQIFLNSELLYKTEPIKTEKGGFQGLFGITKLDGFKIITNKFDSINISVIPETAVSISNSASSLPSGKPISASQLGKLLGVPPNTITNLMNQKGLINGDKITDAGVLKGLVIKNYMGSDYIAYPENLEELKDLKR